MRDIVKVNVAVSFPIWVFDSSGDPVTGLVDANFTQWLTKDGAVNAGAIVITETSAGSRPGRYNVTFTPDGVGVWECVVGPTDAICAANSIARPALNGREFLVTAIGVPTIQELVDAVLDLADTIDGEETLRGAIKLLVAPAAGVGAGTVDKPFLDLSGTKERIAATFASDGARATVTRDTT